MIETIEIKNFKAIEYVNVRVQEFQVLVGANATGKSTFFDSIHLIRDIMQYGLEKAIYGDIKLGIPQRADDPHEITWLKKGGTIEFALTVNIPSNLDRANKAHDQLRYEIAIDTNDVRIESEYLWLISRKIEGNKSERLLFPSETQFVPSHIITKTGSKGWRKVVSKSENGNDYFRSEKTDWNNLFRLGPLKSALGNLIEDPERFPVATWFKRFLIEGTCRLMLNAESMRAPSPVGMPKEFLPDGSNLPWIVYNLEKKRSSEKLNEWTEHLKTALPDLVSIETQEKKENRSRYLFLKFRNGLEAPSWVLSDGTLRLLALTLLAYMEKKPKIILIEEPENGIHPKAIETVLQSLSSVYESQVFCASHSSLVLSLVEKISKIICFAKTKAGKVDIVRGDEHPQLKNWKSAVKVGDLFASGIL